MKKRPEEVKLSRDEGEALIQRLEGDRLSAEDRRLLVRIVELYFWLSFALRETKIGLKRLKTLLFGKGGGQEPPGSDDEGNPPGGGSGGEAGESSSTPVPEHSSSPPATEQKKTEDNKPPRRGHGRWSRQVYAGAEKRICRHEQLRNGSAKAS